MTTFGFDPAVQEQEDLWDAIAANDTEANYEARLYDEKTEQAGFENVVVQDDEKGAFDA